MVDIDPVKLQARGLTPTDIVNAVNAQNLTLPSGLAKIGDTQYTVLTNAMPRAIADLNNIPIKYTNGPTVFLKDVGQVHDGCAVQQNIVREDGRRSVLLSVIKNGDASTVAVVNGVRKVLQIARAAAPPWLSINELFDQSKLVTASIASVVREGAIAAGLTGLMILLFLGSGRSTPIVLISIPLSILTSIVVLYLLGERLNTMNREFPGKVTRISDALQSGTRTLLTEIDIPNPDGTLPPGAYCTVELKIPTDLPR